MVSVNVINNVITGSVNGENYNVPFSEFKYKELSDLAKQANDAGTMAQYKATVEKFKEAAKNSYKGLVEARANSMIYVDDKTGKFYLKVGEKVSRKAMPQLLVDKIFESMDKNIDFMPVVKSWQRFMLNPNFTDAKAQKFAEYINTKYLDRELMEELMEQGYTKEKAREMATYNDVMITQEGLLLTYKVSTEITHKYEEDAEGRIVKKPRYTAVTELDDVTGKVTVASDGVPEFVEERVFMPAMMKNSGDEFYCGDKLGHVIKVGQLHRLPSWDHVNCNDSQSCVKGLHCGKICRL